jgi:hypothetical protein
MALRSSLSAGAANIHCEQPIAAAWIGGFQFCQPSLQQSMAQIRLGTCMPQLLGLRPVKHPRHFGHRHALQIDHEVSWMQQLHSLRRRRAHPNRTAPRPTGTCTEHVPRETTGIQRLPSMNLTLLKKWIFSSFTRPSAMYGCRAIRSALAAQCGSARWCEGNGG